LLGAGEAVKSKVSATGLTEGTRNRVRTFNGREEKIGESSQGGVEHFGKIVGLECEGRV